MIEKSPSHSFLVEKRTKFSLNSLSSERGSSAAVEFGTDDMVIQVYLAIKNYVSFQNSGSLFISP